MSSTRSKIAKQVKIVEEEETKDDEKEFARIDGGVWRLLMRLAFLRLRLRPLALSALRVQSHETISIRRKNNGLR